MDVKIKINESDIEIVKSLFDTNEIPEFGETIVFDNGIELINMTHIKNRFGSMEEIVLGIVLPVVAKEAFSILIKPLINYLKSKLGIEESDTKTINITIHEIVKNIYINNLEDFIINEAEKEKY